MKPFQAPSFRRPLQSPGSLLLVRLFLFPLLLPLQAQEGVRFAHAALRDHGEVALDLRAPADAWIRVESSTNLLTWQALRTLRSAGTNALIAGGAHSRNHLFLRARLLEDPEPLEGDHLATDEGDAVIHPINHASFVIRWRDVWIYNDPVGGAAPYAGLPPADLILISHSHGDHFNAGTLQAVRAAEGRIVAPAGVVASFSPGLRPWANPLANGESMEHLDIAIEAVPAYNANHPRGLGNGYVVTLGGRRLYISGDTGAIAETRALANIDAAFLCMNVPFTMSVADAAAVTRDFRPRILYPYHFRNQNGTFADLEALKRAVGADTGTEIRIRDWY